jgi:hypothetical protein
MASAMAVLATPRLVFNGLPNFWTANDLAQFIFLLGCIVTSITMQEGDASRPDSQTGFVSVATEEVANTLTGYSHKMQPYLGAPRSILIERQHTPGVCSKCKAPGHIARQCIRCKTCNQWGHGAPACPAAARPAARTTRGASSSGHAHLSHLTPTTYANGSGAGIVPPHLQRQLEAALRRAAVAPAPAPPAAPAAVRGALAAALTPSPGPAPPASSGPAPPATALPEGLTEEQRRTTQSRIDAVAASLERSNARLSTIEPGTLFHRAALSAIEALLEEGQRLTELLSPSPTIRPSG